MYSRYQTTYVTSFITSAFELKSKLIRKKKESSMNEFVWETRIDQKRMLDEKKQTENVRLGVEKRLQRWQQLTLQGFAIKEERKRKLILV